MRRVPSKILRFSLAVVIVSSCIGCDQATKRIASRSLAGAPTQSFLGDTLRFEYALNPGGFLSLGSNLPPTARYWIFIGFNVALMSLVAAALMVRWNQRLLVFIPLLCILAGGIGNLIDRVAQNGLVTDFINVGIGPLRTGIFNVADVAVTFGAIALVLSLRINGAGQIA